MKLIIFLLLIVNPLYANENVKLHLGVEDKEMLISLESDASLLLGEDFKTKNDGASKTWSNNILKIFSFEKELKCQVKEKSWKLQDKLIEAEAQIKCLKPIKKSELKILFKKYFKETKALRLKILAIPNGTDQVFSDPKEIKITL